MQMKMVELRRSQKVEAHLHMMETVVGGLVIELVIGRGIDLVIVVVELEVKVVVGVEVEVADLAVVVVDVVEVELLALGMEHVEH